MFRTALVLIITAIAFSVLAASVDTEKARTEFNSYLDSIESGTKKTSPASVAGEIVKAVRGRYHFPDIGGMLPNNVELCNPLQRTMIMYMSSNRAIKKWIELEKQGAGVAIRNIANPDEELAVVSLYVVGKAGNVTPKDIARIEKVMLSDKRWVVRNRAVLALFELKQMDSVKKALNDPNWNVRLLASRAIGRTGDFDGLMNALMIETANQQKSPDEVYIWEDGPRYWVLRGIAHEFKMNLFENRLNDILRNDPDPANRLKVIMVYSWMEESGDAWNGLNTGLEDKDARVRVAAVEGMGYQRWVNRDFRELVRMLKDPEIIVRKATVDTVLAHWNPLNIEHLAPILDNASLDIAYASASAILGLRNQLSPEKSIYNPLAPEEEKKKIVEEAKALWTKYADKIKLHDLSELDFLAPPELPDLDILTVQLMPEYSWGTKKVRPDIGEIVTWVASVENKGKKPTGNFIWTVSLNGEVVFYGNSKSLEPNQQVKLEWKTPFIFSNDLITFKVTPTQGVKEITDYNNTLTVRENSIAAGYWVEDSRRLLYDKIQAYFHRGANSYEDWQQRNLAFWNASIRRSVYLLMPEGGLEFIRAQKIVRLPDGALPLNGGLTGNNPDLKDHTVDVMWGFPGKDVEKKDPFGLANWSVFTWLECSLHHEMSHARYLVDFYGLVNRYDDVEVRDQSGRRIFMPTQDLVYETMQGIIMKSGYFAGYSEAHSAAWGRIFSRRAINGAWNASPNLGEYLSDLPSSTKFTILDSDGKPLPDAVVDIYQSYDDPREWNDRGFYDRQFYDKPDISGVTNPNGEFVVNRQVFSGDRISGYLGNTFIFLVVRAGEQYDWRFYDITQFNMGAWENGFGEASFTFKTNIATNGTTPPVFTFGERKDNDYILTWTPTASSYELYMKNGNYNWDLIASGIKESTYTFPAKEYRQYAVVGVSNDGKKTARSTPFIIPPYRFPQRVGSDIYGNRFFTSNGIYVQAPNGSHLGWQQRYARALDFDVAQDGAFVFLSPNEKRKVKEVDIDMKGRVIVLNNNSYIRWISGDDEASRLADPKAIAVAPDYRVFVLNAGTKEIVVFDKEGNALKRFGGDGADDGKFLTPIDIDIHSSGLIAVSDESQGTIQFFDLDGNYRKKLSGINNPRSVAFDPYGNVYVATPEGISIFNPEGNPIATIEQIGGENLTDILDLDVTSGNEILISRKDKDRLFVLPPVNAFTMSMSSNILVEGQPADITINLNKKGIDATLPSNLEILTNDGRVVAKANLATGQVDNGFSVKYLTILPDISQFIGKNSLFVDVKSRNVTLRYSFPIIVKKPLDISTQLSREKRHPGDKYQTFDFSIVMDNNTGAQIPSMVALGELPSRVVLISKQKQVADIQPYTRQIMNFQVKLDTSTGIYSVPVSLHFNAGSQQFTETQILETPIAWKIFGPIPGKPDEGYATAYPPETKIDFNQTFEKDGVLAEWFDLPPHWVNLKGIVFLEQYLNPCEDVGAYAYTVLYSEKEQDAQLRFGTDDTITVWFNGEKVIDKNSRRGVKVDEDIVPVKIKAGANTVLLKVWQGGGGWGFIMRVTDSEGNLIPSIRAVPESK